MIGDHAFYNCIKLRSVIGLEHVSGSLERIGRAAFHRCLQLTALNLSCLAHLEYLDNNAWNNCQSLTVVDLSHWVRLRAIGVRTFWKCQALRTIRLPPHLKEIHRKAFGKCTALVRIVLPAGVETMGHGTFGVCSRLTHVTFQSTRCLGRLMKEEPFLDCSALQTLQLQGPRELWPHWLEQFLRKGSSGILAKGGIRHGTQRITIAWNFVRANIVDQPLDWKENRLLGPSRYQ